MSRRSLTKEVIQLAGSGEVWLRFPSEWHGIIIDFSIQGKARLFVGNQVLESLPILDNPNEQLGFTHGIHVLQGQAFGMKTKGYAELTFTMWLSKPHEEE